MKISATTGFLVVLLLACTGAGIYLIKTFGFPTSSKSSSSEPDPTATPTTVPTIVPSSYPTLAPTNVPSSIPSVNPTTTPITAIPSVIPTPIPTVLPTIKPSVLPTTIPTTVPSIIPSVNPTIAPTFGPTATPSSPTATPTIVPSTPSMVPTISPTSEPTIKPSMKPTTTPTILPSIPSMVPTTTPTISPTTKPSLKPTSAPTIAPSAPSMMPTTTPSTPTNTPSIMPSTPTTVPTVSPTALPVTCFPQDAVVVLSDAKGEITLGDLQYGDKVLTVDKNGNREFKEVYMMGHRYHNKPYHYINLVTRSHTLKLSAGHYARICTAGCDGDDDVVTDTHRSTYVYGNNVHVGDKLLVFTNDSYDQLFFSEVLHVFQDVENGIFAPFVRGSDLVINGVVVSPHAIFFIGHLFPYFSSFEPFVYEAMFSPMYWTYKMIGPKNMEKLFDLLNVHKQEASAEDGNVEEVLVLNILKLILLVSIPLFMVATPFLMIHFLIMRNQNDSRKRK